MKTVIRTGTPLTYQESPAICVLTFLFLSFCAGSRNPENINWYLTNPDKSPILEKQPALAAVKRPDNIMNTIVIDDTEQYQVMDGFGFALTGGSAIHINAMNPEARKDLLNELFAREDNSIAVSYLRVSIGASDLSDRVFSYNDLPPGETDPEMKRFSIEPERKDLIPVLKVILQINPDIKILGSPWSPPVWMKTNNSSIGGSLKPEFYDAYALYFVKYIEEMKAEGIRIDAITIQNEPLHPGNNPSMYMTAGEQAAFISKSLGPAFRKADIDSKIIIYDHNPNRIDYPVQVLNDPEARQYIDGSAFHMYEGEVEAISEVKKAHPDKNLYFTEQWMGAPGNFANDLRWHVKTIIIGATRNWCKNVVEWNLAADQNQDPHTEGGCTSCLGAVTIDGNSVTRNPAYYVIAHASKFVSPGSVRIKSNIPESIQNVAFMTPTGDYVIIVLNDSDKDQAFQITFQDKTVNAALKTGAVATFTWPQD
jgi:glucosylceramidase